MRFKCNTGNIYFTIFTQYARLKVLFACPLFNLFKEYFWDYLMVSSYIKVFSHISTHETQILNKPPSQLIAIDLENI